MLWKALTILALASLAAVSYAYLRSSSEPAQQPWNSGAIKATYQGTQLKQTDSANASLLVSYDLENQANIDYRFVEGPAVTIMSRITSNHSLSSQEDIRLAYPVFLPAGQRSRITLQLRHAFQWPSESDVAFQDKLKDFVNQRLGDVEEFVFFDQTCRCQIALPRGWQELRLRAAATAGATR